MFRLEENCFYGMYEVSDLSNGINGKDAIKSSSTG